MSSRTRPPRLLSLAFTGLLLVVLAAAVPADTAAPVERSTPRIVAIGDVHGAAESFASLLKKAGLVNEQQRWSGGNAILVQIGDMTDRGAGTRAALDLLMSLEEQARQAGGRVHALLGNHEVMNMAGELRDASPEIVATFGGESAMREAFGPRGRYGRWLRENRVMIEIDETIFMHAGIDPAFSEVSLNDINRRARREMTEWDDGVKWLVERKLVSPSPAFLDAVEAARAELGRLVASSTRDQPETRQAAALLLPLANIGNSSLFSPNGPLWFRGFTTWSDEEGKRHVQGLLDKLRASRFVTGHTVQPTGRITERFGGTLFLIDTGILNGAFYPNGRPSALEITGTTTRHLYLE